MDNLEINTLDWEKMAGLLPAIIQNIENGRVLMLGYMNQEALIATLTTGQLTLYSDAHHRVWRKGEESGNSMAVKRINVDCDNASLLVQVVPKGPACHLCETSCYKPSSTTTLGFLDELIDAINERADEHSPKNDSSERLASGINSCARKVGEEALDTILAATSSDKEALVNKSAHLIFHLLVLLNACDSSFYDVLRYLEERENIT